VTDDELDDECLLVETLLRASVVLVGITVRWLGAVSDEMTFAQFRTLVNLWIGGPLPVTKLAVLLGVHPAAMTRMSTRLVERGLVTRVASDADRRVIVVTLTPEGTNLVNSVMKRRADEFDRAVLRMTDADRMALRRGLDAFLAAIPEAPDVTPADAPLGHPPLGRIVRE
jgi:DNA-binding MarR family transcriptional regulator